jgi:hypothetical protein
MAYFNLYVIVYQYINDDYVNLKLNINKFT